MYTANMSQPCFEDYLAMSLKLWVGHASGWSETPLPLQGALHHAVFGGGARLRPRLCLAVASAYGASAHPVALASAAAIEFLHSASLVHDDLPCFDDAATRRGKPSVHRAFGESIALLAGDSLIMAAFAILVRATRRYPRRASRAMRELARAGRLLVAGQALESCPNVDLAIYHRQKTGALFEAATICGAVAAGAPLRGWREVGKHVGLAYQLADDMADAKTDDKQPNVIRFGDIGDPQVRLRGLLDGARAAVPPTKSAPKAIGLWFDKLTQQILAA
jgi:geranylgeranyl diphosphate synthase type II